MKKCPVLIICLIFAIGSLSCRKFVQAPPPVTELAGTSVFATNSAAASALSGIYITMEGNSLGGGQYGISSLLGLSADDFNLFPGSGSILSQVYTNSQTSNNVSALWYDLYNIVYQVNAVIEGSSNSTGITPAFRSQLIGEAEFIRAFCYFYLLNIYGNIPLITSTDYKINETLGQSSSTVIYGQIMADLRDAYNQLGANYLDAQGTTTTERVRPNNGAVAALLARIYLYNAKYDSAEQEATLVIDNSAYVLYQDLDSVFLTSSQEAIWQLECKHTTWGMFDSLSGAPIFVSEERG